MKAQIKTRPSFIPDEQRRTYQDKLKAAQEPKSEPTKKSDNIILPNRHINVKRYARVKKVLVEAVQEVVKVVIPEPKEKTFEEKLEESKAKLAKRQAKSK